MRIVLSSAIIVNLIAIILLLVGVFCNFKNPKNKAIFGYFVAGSIIMYIITLSIALLCELMIMPNYYCIGIFLCLISPFIIGKLVKYKTLKKYTFIQIICFSISLTALLINYITC